MCGMLTTCVPWKLYFHMYLPYGLCRRELGGDRLFAYRIGRSYITNLIRRGL